MCKILQIFKFYMHEDCTSRVHFLFVQCEFNALVRWMLWGESLKGNGTTVLWINYTKNNRLAGLLPCVESRETISLIL